MTTPTLPTKCPACAHVAVLNGVCGHCGWADAATNTCPHCGAVARIEPRGAGVNLRWVCGVCGGPRIPNGLGGLPATTALKEAKSLRSRAVRSKASSVVLMMMAAFATLVLLVAWPAAIVAKLILFTLAALPAFGAARARAGANTSLTKANEAEDRAWLAAAEDAATKHPNGITEDELARLLAVDKARAEKLLTELAVHDRTRIDVGDDAEVRYSVPGAARVRVSTREEEDAALDDPLEREFAEMEKAEAKRMKGPR